MQPQIFDVFICHASEDKAKIVLPLVAALKRNNIKYWLDQIEILWGDSITQKINEGISKSKYAILVLSKNMTNKNWFDRLGYLTRGAQSVGFIAHNTKRHHNEKIPYSTKRNCILLFHLYHN